MEAHVKTLRTEPDTYKGSVHVSCDGCHLTARIDCLILLLTGHEELRALCLPPSHWKLLEISLYLLLSGM